jgi:hypothetical protein
MDRVRSPAPAWRPCHAAPVPPNTAPPCVALRAIPSVALRLRLDVRLPLPLPAEACRPRDVTCFSLLRTSLPGPAPRGPAQPGLIGPAVRCALLRVSGAAGPRYRAPALLRGTAPSSPPPSPTQSTGFQPSHGTLRVPAASPPAATAAAATPHSGPHLFEDLCALVTPDSLNAIAGDQRVACLVNRLC